MCVVACKLYIILLLLLTSRGWVGRKQAALRTKICTVVCTAQVVKVENLDIGCTSSLTDSIPGPLERVEMPTFWTVSQYVLQCSAE